MIKSNNINCDVNDCINVISEEEGIIINNWDENRVEHSKH